MVRALTRCNRWGVPYTRPSAVEKSITEAVTQSRSTLRARARIEDPRDPHYLASEVVVHLIRNAFRANDGQTASALLVCLRSRCTHLLKRRVRLTYAFDATQVQEEIIGRLYELFAQDLDDQSRGTLDYYEARFNRAFAKLRADVIAAEIGHWSSLEPFSNTERDDGSECSELPSLAPHADPVVQAENAHVHRLLQALPPQQRDALVWKYLFEHKTESSDPSEITVATLSGVSGREVRSRLKAAKDNLLKRIKACTSEAPDCARVGPRFLDASASQRLGAEAKSRAEGGRSRPVGHGQSAVVHPEAHLEGRSAVAGLMHRPVIVEDLDTLTNYRHHPFPDNYWRPQGAESRLSAGVKHSRSTPGLPRFACASWTFCRSAVLSPAALPNTS